jgi:hypothetical protein
VVRAAAAEAAAEAEAEEEEEEESVKCSISRLYTIYQCRTCWRGRNAWCSYGVSMVFVWC